MQANWSIILNVLLLVGVVVAIGRLIIARRESLRMARYQPSHSSVDRVSLDAQTYNDEIIAIRKINQDDSIESVHEVVSEQAQQSSSNEEAEYYEDTSNAQASSTIMMFLLAKENRQFAGYELLQTLLAAGLRFGEGHLFHRHQFANGQGPVLCSLAAATETGIFDLQNIGAFSVRGLCLFMHTSGNPTIDAERFSIMLETAKQLSESLDAHLLDEHRKPLSENRIASYYRQLQMEECEV